MYKTNILFNPSVVVYGEDALKELFALEHKVVCLNRMQQLHW